MNSGNDYYVVVKQPPRYHQLTLEDFLFGLDTEKICIGYNESNTRTYKRWFGISETLNILDIEGLIEDLAEFNRKTDSLRREDRHSLYREFYIPKKSGGLRKIDAPNYELMLALRELKEFFEGKCRALAHTSAFAYVKGRSTVDAVKRHQTNESRWYAKYDLSNFFGSTTPEFVIKMLEKVYPFCCILMDERGRKELTKALDLAFLDGGLPQGTPLSPMLTNIIMVPIDFRLANDFRDFKFTGGYGSHKGQRLVYTRYADDFIISSQYDFGYREIERYIKSVLSEFDAPFSINAKKTRYGSRAGANWNLGVMLNDKNQITIGHKRKREFKAMLSNFVNDMLHYVHWDLNDVQVLEGLRSYYKMVEGEAIDEIVEKVGQKYHVDVVQMIKDELSR